jgi:hypothetical protein
VTDRKSSFLTGLSLANQYAAGNAFKGNAAADFGAMLLFRSATPFDGFGSVSRFLCGNLQAVAGNNTKGWGLRWVAGAQPAGQLELVYGDSALAQQSFVARPLTPTQMAQRTMLVHVFVLRDPSLSAPNNVVIVLYVNGALVAQSVGVSAPVAQALSFTPADGTGTFRIGGSTINGSAVDAPGIGVCGFGYCSSVQGSTLAAKLAAVQAMVDATTAQSLATGDISDDALVTNLFSVRRALPNPAASWVASKGPVNLPRVGSSALAVEAGEPLFGDVPWADLTPVPDMLEIFGPADLLGWWRADSIVQAGGFVSQANDLSGNGRHLVQGTGALQPRFSATGGPNGTPAFVYPGGASAAGASVRLSRTLAAMGLNPGDFPSLFVVQKMDLATSNNLGVTFAIGDSVSGNQLITERRNTTAPGYFGGNAALAGASGGFNGPLPLDSDPHLQALLLQALAANIAVDGVLGPNKTTTGGLLTAPDTIDLGGSSIFVSTDVGFGGLIPEAWLLRVQPSPAQLAGIAAYVRNRYGITIS